MIKHGMSTFKDFSEEMNSPYKIELLNCYSYQVKLSYNSNN